MERLLMKLYNAKVVILNSQEKNAQLVKNQNVNGYVNARLLTQIKIQLAKNAIKCYKLIDLCVKDVGKVLGSRKTMLAFN